jgi:hypothetical protein
VLLPLLLLTPLQSRQVNARISRLFITYAPIQLAEQLTFNATLPLTMLRISPISILALKQRKLFMRRKRLSMI